MNILVTGGAGYVGSVCAEILITRGHAVFVFDNLSVGYRRAVPQSAVFFEGDLADRQALDRLFAAHQIEAVMHFAAFALVEESVRKPSAYYVNNVANSIQLLDAMVRHRVKKLIFSSSAAIYGEPKIAPIPEEHQAAPINPYGHTKLTFERILEDCGAATGLQYACLRYFNAAGATRERGEDHRPETHLIPILLQVALGQRPNFPINGTDYPTHDGTCIRDFVHVFDIAEAHVLALDQLERISGHVFNIGSNRGHSVREALETARRVTGHPIPVVEASRRPGDPAILVASSQKTERVLGWRPQFSSLSTIVESAWAWKQKFPFGYGEDRQAAP